jgi:hypothetical protein
VTDEDTSAGDIAYVQTSERDRGAAPRPRAVSGGTVLLDSPGAGQFSTWQNPHARISDELAAPYGARDYSSGPFDGKRAIDWESEQIVHRPGRRASERFRQSCAELVEPRTCPTRAWDDERSEAVRLVEQRFHIVSNERKPFRIDEIGLGERNDDARNLQQLQDQQMLPCLGHHAFVSGDYEQTEVDSSGADKHAAHEIFVTRNIDDADCADSVEREWSEAEVDGYAAPLLFGKPVGVNAGQRAHQRCFPVIDVARRSDYHAAVQRSCSHTANARSGRSSVK